MQAFNELSPAETERIALLMEECAEVIQACGKILRHGYESCHPNTKEWNRDALEKEIGHVQAALEMMYEGNDIKWESVNRQRLNKEKSVQQYLHEQPPND